MASAPDNSGEWRSVVTSASTAKAAAVRRIAPTLCGSVTWSRTSDEAVRRQFGDIDRGERPRLEQQALMDRIARAAGGNLLEAQDARFDAARLDRLPEPLGRGRRRIEADELAPRRLQRRLDAVEAVDAHEIAVALLAGLPLRRGCLGVAAGRPCGFAAGEGRRSSRR